MKKQNYIQPQTAIVSLDPEENLMIAFSQVDNDGDGNTDQTPIIEGDPDEIG